MGKIEKRRELIARTARAALELLEPRLLLCGDGGLDDLDGVPVPPPLPGSPVAQTAPPATTSTTAAAGAASTLHPLSAIPALSSDPGAPNTLYLDFHGEPAQQWGLNAIPATPAYDADGDPTTFSDQELANLQEIWARVAEKFSPFNLNVTTVDPGNWNLAGTGSANHQLRAVIGGNGSWAGGGGYAGVAQVGSFYTDYLGNSVYSFAANMSANPLYVAEDISHESGHGFGLQHQSVYSGTTKTAEYGQGDSLTAPIMGISFYSQRGLWWDGQSTLGYNVIQDDVAVLAGHLGLRPLAAAGHSAATAAALGVSGSTIAGSAGVIESTAQQDYYAFSVATAAAASDTFTLNVAPLGPTLHGILQLRDAADHLIASAASAATLGQTLTATLAPGNYYLVVTSYGQYGDLGQYTLSGTLAAGSSTPPTLTLAGASSVNEGAAYTLSLAASDPGHTIGAWSINWGDGSAAQAVAGNPASVTHTYSVGPHAYTISATATDDAGTYSAGNTVGVSVLHVPPALSISGAGAVNELAAYTLGLSASDPNHVIRGWSINWGDGSAAQAIAGTPASVTHTYATGPHTYTISATATDDAGAYSAGNTVAVNVLHVPPTLSISGTSSVNEGSLYTLGLAASDPAGHTIGAWSINWGDGSAAQAVAGSPASVTHAYAVGPHTWTISATATDDAGTYAAGNTLAVAVNDVPPTIALSGAPTVNEGAAYALTLGAVSDPGADVVSGYVVHWGDGASDSFSAAAAAAAAGAKAHVFADAGVYNVVVDVVDENGTHAGAGALAVNVLDVPPAVTIGGLAGVALNAPYTLTLAAVEPAGAGGGDAVSSWSINWGDGSAIQAVAGSATSATHLFAQAGTFSVSASMTDGDGTWNAANVRAVAVSAAPVFTIAGNPSVNEQTYYYLYLYASDPGHAVQSWSVNWGDGSALQSVPGTWQFVAHGFLAGPNTYTISAAATDDANATYAAAGTQAVSVLHVPPTLAIAGPSSVAAGAALTLSLAASDPGHAIQSWSVNWGDGSAVQTFIAGAGSGSAAAAHVYLAGGSYAVSATATDDVGTYAAGNTLAVSVSGPADTTPPTVAATAIPPAATPGAATFSFSIAYADDGALSLATLDGDDVLVSGGGPSGFSQLATLSGLSAAANAPSITATYTINAPGGSWSYAANGTYMVSLLGSSVADAAGNAMPAQPLGSFAVAALRPPTANLGKLPGKGRKAASASVVVGQPGPAALYGFTLDQAQIVTLQASTLKPGLTLMLLDANQAPLFTRIGKRAATIAATLGPGTYYVQLSLTGGGAGGGARGVNRYQLAAITRPVPQPKRPAAAPAPAPARRSRSARPGGGRERLI